LFDTAYEKHVEKNGQPESHEKAKELFAGFAGYEADKCVLPFILSWAEAYMRY
jgi:hypothetical protein